MGFAMTIAKFSATLALLASFAAPAAAAGPPAAALNKTITIAFTATGNAKSADGRTRTFSTAVTHTVYVSSAGRLFTRHLATNGRATRTRDFAPGETGQRGGSAHFQGNKLVIVMPFFAGARQMIATFDAGFTSCTASIVEGHAAGGTIRRIGPNDVMYEITAATTASPSCSIRSGNEFAR
jgi:hypothetical protein